MWSDIIFSQKRAGCFILLIAKANKTKSALAHILNLPMLMKLKAALIPMKHVCMCSKDCHRLCLKLILVLLLRYMGGGTELWLPSLSCHLPRNSGQCTGCPTLFLSQQQPQPLLSGALVNLWHCFMPSEVSQAVTRWPKISLWMSSWLNDHRLVTVFEGDYNSMRFHR